MKQNFIIWVKKSSLILGLLICFYCKQPVDLTVITGQAFGTSYQIKYDSKTLSESELTTALDSIFSVVNHSMSTYVPTSLVSQINSRQTSIKTDPHFENVFRISQNIWGKTNGYFDPTVGPLVNAYGFGPEGIKPFKHQNIDSLKQWIGLEKVSLNNGVLSKRYPEISLDFNAVAKGYTVDLIGQLLTENKIQDFLIELGGEVLVNGINPKTKNNWSIGIENPILDSLPRILKIVELKNQAQATSGNYRKFWIDSLTGKRFVHTINPKTGLVQNSNILSVSVIANTCTQADAMATALLAMPFDEAIELIEKEKDFEALWIYSNNNQLALHYSGGFGLLRFEKETSIVE